MAILQSPNVQKGRPAVTADDMDAVTVRGELVLAAPLLVGDVLQMVIVPAGTRVVDVSLDSSAPVGTVTAAVGVSSAVTASAVNGIVRMDSAAAVQAAAANADQLAALTVTVGGGLTGDVVGMSVTYRNARQGE